MDKNYFNDRDSNISLGGLAVRKYYCIGMRQRGKRDYGAYHIPKFDGGQAADGRTYKKNIWDPIYKFLCDNEVDVREYISFVFDTSRTISTPNGLKSPGLIDRYKQYKAKEIRPQIWELEVDKLMTELAFKSNLFPDDITKGYACILLDKDIQVSPLTRYSFGVLLGFDDLVKPLEEAAFRQYYERRYFYERYYSDKIPENIRKKAVELDGNR